MLKRYSNNTEWPITDFYLISEGFYMKHQKEWRACDRCGAEIEKGILCGNLITQNSTFNTVYDLCPKCMEDFEEFMRNDS
jgi:hypothetical protein